MPAAQHDITIDQGATFQMTLRVKDSAGTPINFSGYSARMQVRETIDAASALLSLTESSGITLGTDGTIAIVASAVQTAAMSAVNGYYDLEVESGSVVTRYLTGRCRVLPEVTR